MVTAVLWLLLVTVMVFGALTVFLLTVPKFRELGERLTETTPFPVTVNACGLWVELSAIHTVPAIVPLTDGLNVPEKVHVCVAASASPLLQGIVPLATAE